MGVPAVLLIRHGQSTWNAAGRWQGHGDPPLSPLGRRQAFSLAQTLAGTALDRILCSDLRRAIETADVLGEALGIAPQVDPALRELDVGRWSGLTRRQIADREPELLARFDRDEPDVRPGGGESRRELAVRARGALARIVGERPGARIAVVTHLGVIRALVPGAAPRNGEIATGDVLSGFGFEAPATGDVPSGFSFEAPGHRSRGASGEPET